MTHRSLGSLCGLLIVSAGAFGCSSSSPPAADGGPLSPTFTNVYQAILEPQCSLHHAAGAADSFLTFETQANAYKTLVNVKASGPACGIVTPAGDASRAGERLDEPALPEGLGSDATVRQPECL